MQKLKNAFPAHSLLWRLFGCTAGCVAVFLAVLLLLNTFALKPYYMKQKQTHIVAAFDSINACETSDALQKELEYLQYNDTVSVVIWADRQILYSTLNQQRYSLPARPDLPLGGYSLRQLEDDNGAAIALLGHLNDGAFILLRTPIAAIEESAAVFNRFLLFCGGGGLLLALGLALLLSRSLTVPLRKLSRVAENVAALDFSDSYTGGGKDELAALGKSIDTMSHALEGTITELKNANLRLQSDIEVKTRQNEAHRAFIANVSHELKTPLALIGTYAESLPDIENEQSRAEYCAVIRDETQRMSDMLRRMTLLMQISSGEQLTVERFDVTELFRNVIQRLAPQFADCRATVIPPAAAPQFVFADSFLIEDVLQNYLTNAFHHVTAGGIISGTVTPTANGSVHIAVLNTGNPIPEEELPRIWESFYKVDKAHSRSYGGSGIGLSVVAAIMQAHRMPYGVRNCRAPDGKTAVEFYIELQTR